MKLVFVVSLLFCSFAYAEDKGDYFKQMDKIIVYARGVTYEATSDCPYPSDRKCRTDEHGQEHCIIVQDERCK